MRLVATKMVLGVLVLAQSALAEESPMMTCGQLLASTAVHEDVCNTPPARQLGFARKKITLDVRSADLENVLRLLATEGQANIVLGPGVSGNVTLKLTNVLVADAFAVLVKAQGLTWEKVGSIILVTRSR